MKSGNNAEVLNVKLGRNNLKNWKFHEKGVDVDVYNGRM